MARNFWHSLLRQPPNISNNIPNDHWMLFLKNLNPHDYKLITIPTLLNWEDLFSITIWNLWLNRNSNNINTTSYLLLAFTVTKYSLEYKFFTDRVHNTSIRIPLCISWHAPPIGWFKLNVDGAFRRGKPISGIGGLIRNADSKWTFGFLKSIHADSPIHAELQAIHQGLTFAA